MQPTWNDVMKAGAAGLLADSILTTELGGPFIGRMQHGRERRIKSVRYQLAFAQPQEVMLATLVQFDYWTDDAESAEIIETRLLAVLHHETRRTFGSIEMLTQLAEMRERDDDPKAGIIHGSLDFRFEPVKRR